MEAVYVPILVALIGGPVMWFLARFDKRNTEQHGENMKILSRVEDKVDRVDGRSGGIVEMMLVVARVVIAVLVVLCVMTVWFKTVDGCHDDVLDDDLATEWWVTV